MSWTHSSKGVILGVLLAVSLATVGTAAAISVSGDAPEAQNVNDTAEMNATIEEPFNGPPEQWTLVAETDLENPSWSYEVYEQGSRVDSGASDNETFRLDLDSTGTTTPTRVEISVSGDVPDDIEYNYEDISAENYTALTLSNAEGTEYESYDAHRYTEGSQDAREAIDDAQAAIDEAGGSSDAEDRLGEAISSYDNGNFQNAIDIANDAQSIAEDEQSSGGLPIALIAGAAVIVLLVVGGGAYYYKSQQSQDYKLQ